MSYNVPSYTTDNITFGPAVITIGAVGTTPSVEIGAVTGDHEFNVGQELLELYQGSPQTLVQQYVQKEDVGISFSGVEWNLDNLKYFLGSGSTGASGAEETFEFGGTMTKASYAMRYVHRTATGGTVDIHLFNVQGAGGLPIAMKETDFHEFPFEFKVLEGSTDFEGSALVDGKKRFKIVKTNV